MRKALIFGMGFWFTLAIPARAHASLLAKVFYFFRTTISTTPKKITIPGQETRSFKLRKAKAEDLLVPIQNYLDGISKTGGSVQVRSADNALVATDFQENLTRLSVLIPDIDQVYDNANPMARQMLATQSLMKAIRTHAGFASAPMMDRPSAVTNKSVSGPASAPAPAQGSSAAGVTPVFKQTHHRDADDMTPHPLNRALINPTLMQFEMVGWMRDEHGYTVILSNSGQRFIYRGGKLHGGTNPKSEPLEGIQGVIRDNQLILNDRSSKVSLQMFKWHDL